MKENRIIYELPINWWDSLSGHKQYIYALTHPFSRSFLHIVSALVTFSCNRSGVRYTYVFCLFKATRQVSSSPIWLKSHRWYRKQGLPWYFRNDIIMNPSQLVLLTEKTTTCSRHHYYDWLGWLYYFHISQKNQLVTNQSGSIQYTDCNCFSVWGSQQNWYIYALDHVP